MDRKLDELLFALTENMTVAVSGERLARDLGVSHSTLVRWVDKLREAGVEIRGELFTGYRLTRLPDIVLPQFIKPRLRTQTFGRAFYHFYTVDSTNAFALRLLSHGRSVPEGALILSESQTAGRGRLGRSWHSEPGTGLYFSVVLRPETPPHLTALHTLGCAVALHDAVEHTTGIAADIKWPNDLLVGRKKAAGILAEIQGEADRIHALVMGVGLNVNQTSLPPELADRATSLQLFSGRSHSRLEILADFLERFEVVYTRFRGEGPGSITSAWTSRSSFATERTIEVSDGFRTISGVTRGLSPAGALRVETAAGSVEEVYSGEVINWQ
jgi:BirA family biotin operon repressor/biotin-[acetyl-CoA-carboxylase] ligase